MKGEAWPRPLVGLRRAPGRGRWLTSSQPCPVLGLGLQGQGRRLGAVSGREGPLARLHSAVCVSVWACERACERVGVCTGHCSLRRGSTCNRTGGIQSLPRPPCKASVQIRRKSCLWQVLCYYILSQFIPGSQPKPSLLKGLGHQWSCRDWVVVMFPWPQSQGTVTPRDALRDLLRPACPFLPPVWRGHQPSFPLVVRLSHAGQHSKSLLCLLRHEEPKVASES